MAQISGGNFSSDDEVLGTTVNPNDLLTEESSSSDSWHNNAGAVSKAKKNRPIILDTPEISSDDTWDGNRISPDKSNKSAKFSSDETWDGNLISPDKSDKTAKSNSDDSDDIGDEPQNLTQETVNRSKSNENKLKSKDNKKSKAVKEVIDLTVNDDINLNQITQDIVVNREANLKAERQRLELEAMDATFQLKNLEGVMEKMELDKLPDKGARVQHKLQQHKKQLKSIAERQAFVDKQLQSMKNQPKDVPYINKLPSASMSLSDLGKKALETHNIQRALTVDTLEKLHKSIENQPEHSAVEPKPGLKVTLLPHQKYGLGWALWRENQKPSGGILADDMGLGKTLTTIALILHTSDDKKDQDSDSSSDDGLNSARRKVSEGGTLVITPASVMGQWENEVKSKVIAGKLSCYIYHGPSRKKTRSIHRYDLVLSSYSTILHEDDDDPLMKVRWKRIVLDEAHTIRNAKSKTALSIFNLKGKKRWALTGTPVQNKELDLYALIRFLRCKPFDDFNLWKKWIDNKDVAGIQRLNCILKAILLRRTKEELQTDGSLSSLKSKSFHNMSVSLNEEEYSVYKKVAYFSKTLLGELIHQKAEKENLLHGGMGSIKHRIGVPSEENPFRDHPELRELYRDMMSMGPVKTHHILVLLLRLRQICCHPALAVSVLDSNDLKNDGIENDDQSNQIELVDRLQRMSISKSPQASAGIFQKSEWSSKLRAVIECTMDILQRTEDKLIIVSQWKSVLEIVKDYLLEKDIESVEFTGSVLVKLRPAIIKDFNENVRGPRVLLLSLVAGGTGLNLIGANHLLLIDCHWNPQLEAQACDRVYRVGQLKEVNIYKFVCSNTIEEKIVELQKKKLELSEGVLKGSINTAASKLTLTDMKMLFNVK